jgi:hypothetical protein
MALSKDGKKLAVSNSSNAVRIWDVATGLADQARAGVRPVGPDPRGTRDWLILAQPSGPWNLPPLKAGLPPARGFVFRKAADIDNLLVEPKGVKEADRWAAGVVEVDRIDWDQQMLLLVGGGPTPRGATYETRVTSIKVLGKTMTVTFQAVRTEHIILGSSCQPTLLLVPAFAGEVQFVREVEVPIRQAWSGILRDRKLRQLVPADGLIRDRDTWAKLWYAWRDDEGLPTVNFDQLVVLVLTTDGPNKIAPPELLLDEQGDVRVPPLVATGLPGDGFGFRIVAVPRAGVKSINGRPIQ